MNEQRDEMQWIDDDDDGCGREDAESALINLSILQRALRLLWECGRGGAVAVVITASGFLKAAADLWMAAASLVARFWDLTKTTCVSAAVRL